MPSTLTSILLNDQTRLAGDWTTEQLADGAFNAGRIGETQLRRQCQDFIRLLAQALDESAPGDPTGASWDAVYGFLEDLSRQRVEMGFSSDETARFVFTLKRPIFNAVLSSNLDSKDVGKDLWEASLILDRLGLHTIKAYQRTREDVIARQQNDLLELSTPVIKLWEGVLALPMIGTLDSARSQIVMETLLQRIVDTGSEIAIIDITGVPAVDTLVAQHLMKTVTAIRLMGAECIISGVRPQIAQTIVHLGVNLEGVTTKASLADALLLALRRIGYRMSKGE